MAKPLTQINKNIAKFLNENGIVSRRDAGPGIWLSCLLPLAIALGEIKHPSGSEKFRVASCISCGILSNVLIAAYQIYWYNFSKTKSVLIPSLVTTFLLFVATSEGLVFSIGYGFFSMIAYNEILLPLMKLYPKSFTYGEACVVAQALLLFLLSCFIKPDQTPTDCMAKTTLILQVTLLSVMCIGALSHLLNLATKPFKFYCVSLGVVLFALLPTLFFLLEEDPILWTLYLLTEDSVTIQLLSSWVGLVIVAVIALVIQSKINRKASTVLRKTFHVLYIFVFIPGIIVKPCLLYFASGGAFVLFLVLDMLRVLQMPPLGKGLQAAFSAYSDEKDEGPVAMTPLYLLIGCSLPLWIHPNPLKADFLVLLSGVLSIGVGDTVASACGTWVGKNKWPGSKKTKEGTSACFLSQLFLIIALIHFGYIPRTNLIRPTFAIAATSALEAKTDQVDNLALPLLMYILII